MGAQHQVLLMAGQSQQIPLTGIFSAYSLSKIVQTYAGSCLKIRRSSDNTELDIGFAGQSVNVSALLTFVGAGNGFVSKWYDQTVSGNDIAQATLSLQPQLVDTGTYLGQILWDGVDDILVTPNTPAVTAFTLFFAGRSRVGAQGGLSPNNETFWGHTSGTSVWTSRNVSQSSLLPQQYAETKTDGANRYDNAQARDGTVYANRFDISQGTLATQVTSFVDGVLQVRAGTGGVSSISTGNYGIGVWALGGDGVSSYARLAARTVLIYSSARPDAEILSTSTILGNTFNVNCFDSFTSGLWGLYSLRRQLSSYAGSCLRVRRSSDNAEQDIGFLTNGVYDKASMLTFCAATDGFVTKFYDQSGNVRDFAQSTTGKQPKIVAAGALYVVYGFYFDGIDDCMTTAALSSAVSKFTVVIKAEMFFSGLPASGCILENGTAFNTNNGLGIFYGTNQIESGTGNNTTTYRFRGYNYGPVRQVLAMTYDRTQIASTDVLASFTGGLKQTTSSDLAAGSPAFVPSAITPATWNLGSRNNGASAPTVIAVDTLAIFESLLTDTNINVLSRNLG